MPPILRDATIADLESILAIARDCPEAPHWGADDYSPYLASPSEPPLLRALVVAASEGRILGFAAATLLLDPPGMAAPENRCELESLGVAPAARRQGIGAALLQAILAWAANHGARRLLLEVRESNAAALRLYRKAGLAAEGRRRRYYTEPEEDALLLGMPITSVFAGGSFSTGKSVEGGPPRC